jgi:hypothetical protein
MALREGSHRFVVTGVKSSRKTERTMIQQFLFDDVGSLETLITNKQALV